jgi:transcriptional regulator with XRE-family HTH domain
MSLRALVAASLRTQRLQRGFSQETLGRRCGLSVSYVSMLERGHRSPPLDTLEALSNALGVSPLRLLEERPQPLAARPATSRASAPRRRGDRAPASGARGARATPATRGGR